MALHGFFDYDGTGDADAEALELLRDFTDAQWQALLAFTQTEHYRAGQSLFAAGALERALYVVADGRLEVLSPKDGRRMSTIEEGSVVGEQGFLDARPRSAEVRAITDAHVLKLSLDAFDRFTALHPDLSRAFVFDLARILSLRLRQSNALLVARR